MIGRRRAARDPDSGEPDLGEPDTDEPDTDDPNTHDTDTEGRWSPTSLRRWFANRRPPAGAGAAAPGPPEELDLKPTDMRSPEPLYGYIVALELIAVSILNLTVTHGKGAPTHPSTALALVGLVASLAMAGIVWTHHRLIVAFSSVIAAFFVTLPRVPTSLQTTHLLALFIPVAYAFILTQRQRKAATALTRAGRSGAGARSPAERKTESRGGRRSRKEKGRPAGPTPNRRYTPPKAKRTHR